MLVVINFPPLHTDHEIFHREREYNVSNHVQIHQPSICAKKNAFQSLGEIHVKLLQSHWAKDTKLRSFKCALYSLYSSTSLIFLSPELAV